VFGRHLIWKRCDRVTVGNIEMMFADAHAWRGDFSRGPRQRLIIDIGQCEVTAAARQGRRNCPADPACRPGHDGRSALKVEQAPGPL
jgi:hypothetical protein